MIRFSTVVAVFRPFSPSKYALFLVNRLPIETGDVIRLTEHAECIELSEKIQTIGNLSVFPLKSVDFPAKISDFYGESVLLLSEEEFSVAFRVITGRERKDEIVLELGEVETLKVEFDDFCRKNDPNKPVSDSIFGKLVENLTKRLPKLEEIQGKIEKLTEKQELLRGNVEKLGELREKLTYIRGQQSYKCCLRWVPDRNRSGRLAIISVVTVVDAWLWVYAEGGGVGGTVLWRADVGRIGEGVQVKELGRDWKGLVRLGRGRVWAWGDGEWLGFVDFHREDRT